MHRHQTLAVRASISVLALVATVLALGVPAASAARPPRTSVTITSPADGSSGTAVVVPVTGKASSPSGVVNIVLDGVDSGQTATVDSRGTWSTNAGEFSVGTHLICAEVRVDETALASSCVRRTVTPDPASFTLSWPAPGSEVATRFSVAGECQNGTQAQVTLDGTDTQLVDCMSSWWYTDWYGVAAGPHTVTAQGVLNGTAYTSVESTFTVVAPAPVEVAITSPVDGSTVTDEFVVIRGTSNRPGQLVSVTVNGAYSRETFTDSDGSWYVYGNLVYGANRICADITDGEGFTGQGCSDVTFAVDPSTLTIDTPAEGSLQNAFVDFSGQCKDGSYVRIAVDDREWVAEQYCSGGTYGGGLAYVTDGTRTMTVTMLIGGQEVTSQSRSFVVDTIAPAPPTIVSPDAGTTIRSRSVTMTGTTAEGGLGIQVLHSDGTPYATTTSSATGAWSVVLGEDFFLRAGVVTGKTGSVTVSVTATDAVGNVSSPTSRTWATRIR
jgi:hypothetical protein